jgi:hypothetical protein
MICSDNSHGRFGYVLASWGTQSAGRHDRVAGRVQRVAQRRATVVLNGTALPRRRTLVRTIAVYVQPRCERRKACERGRLAA